MSDVSGHAEVAGGHTGVVGESAEVDVDLRGRAAFTANPYPYYEKLRAAGPVHTVRTDEFDRVWLVVGYDEARAALADPRFAKDWRGLPGAPAESDPIFLNLLELDAPRHTRLRRLVAREFTARRVEALRPRVQQITDELLDAVVPAGRADLVDALAFPLPMTVICELIGVPDLDRDAFRLLSNGVVTPTSPEGEMEAVRAMNEYLGELIEDKRRSPGDDLMSALVRTRDEDGDSLSPDELVGMAFLLLVAGHETTVNLIANGVRALLGHPEQLAALLADPELIGGAVEEMLRYDGPVENSTLRFPREPVRIGQRVIPAGVPVLVSLAGADRDPARYPEPDTFDIRRDAQGHLAFGHGMHFCVGAPLARMEGRIAIRTLLERCPSLAPDAGAGELDWIPGMLLRGVRGLPVRW
ncbi:MULTISPECIES: cytochrome P450 [unclassified Streptomyces]|uniref:cytochrome P450 family protein n=1 Tax=unclassified Streptomyces TaxID=2593676 RepID=UPI003816FA47